MDWKDFLKPTGTIIVLSVLIFSVFVPVIAPDLSSDKIGIQNMPYFNTQPISLLMFVAYAFLIPENLFVNGLILYDNLLFGLVLSYLLACLLVSIYSKYAKRKK